MIKGSVKVGITGSIGMGKTTVSSEISRLDYPVWDSDKVVHMLYRRDNPGFNIIKKIVPEVAVGLSVDRELLLEILLKKPALLKLIEYGIRPILSENKKDFLRQYRNKKTVIFDIPLLFETNCEDWLDCVIVVTAPFSVQKARVLSRKKMTEKKFRYLLSRQFSNKEKINRADFIINTNCNYDVMISEIKKTLERINNEYS